MDSTGTYDYATARLTVVQWGPKAPDDDAAVDAVAAIMTPATTRSLPAGWQGAYDADRARTWIADRLAEGPSLLVRVRTTAEPVGLVLLFEERTVPASRNDPIDLRVGYVLAESAWGAGLATELVQGLVDRCREAGGVRSLIGGVSVDNDSSARVLAKAGFLPTGPPKGGERTYRLRLD